MSVSTGCQAKRGKSLVLSPPPQPSCSPSTAVLPHPRPCEGKGTVQRAAPWSNPGWLHILPPAPPSPPSPARRGGEGGREEGSGRSVPPSPPVSPQWHFNSLWFSLSFILCPTADQLFTLPPPLFVTPAF